MIDTRFLSVFLSGIATAYFALSAYFLFRRKESSRLQIVVGCIFLQWTVLNLKDFIFTQYDASSQVLQDIVVLLDGTSLIGYTFLLYELIRPRWATWRKALGMLMVYIPFFNLCAVWPSQTVINCYLVCLTIAGTVIFFVWLRQALTYAKYIRDNFSNIDDTDISWLRIVALFFVICQLIWVAISIIRVPLAYWLAEITKNADYPHGQPIALYGSLLISWVLGMVMSVVMFWLGNWRKKMMQRC